MPRSTKMFVEQSNLAMPPSVWLHINGVSLTTDVLPYQPPIHTYDYRTKHLQSPIQPPTPPLISPTTIVPCSITMIDGPFSNHNNNNKQYQKLENAGMPKKFFVDRHIKKAKSLPGLIKGTALSRHTPFQSSTFASPASTINPPTNTIQDDQLPIITADNDSDSLANPPSTDTQIEPRRPRVYFADFNKILFLEDNHEVFQQHQTPVPQSHRRNRRRLTKKTSNSNGTHQTSPSIQPTQTLQTLSHPLSRQPNYPIAQELSIKKQQFASPRPHSSRLAHLPEILNQSLSTESTSNEKHLLQREKSLVRLPKSIIEIPSVLPADLSPEDTHQSISHSSPLADSHISTHESESGENTNGLSIHGSSSVSQTSVNRPRPSLRTISLRQQFISSFKSKPTGISSIMNTNNYYQQLNTRRSASLKQPILPIPNENDDARPNNGISSTMENNRSILGNRSAKQLKRSDAIHFNSKNPLGGNATNDSTRTHVHEPTPERFQNLLTVVRPPYGNGNGYSPTITSITPSDSTIQSIHHHQSMGNYRSTRVASARESFGYHPTSSTIIV